MENGVNGRRDPWQVMLGRRRVRASCTTASESLEPSRAMAGAAATAAVSLNVRVRVSRLRGASAADGHCRSNPWGTVSVALL